MTPPRQLVRVEWMVCRHPSDPLDRQFQSRNFSTPERAGEQVLAVRIWEPKYAELLGVWRSSGWRDGDIEWTEVDPESLPITQDAEYRYSQIASGPTYQEMMQ